LLIATDQEGGQLVALGEQTTQFAGAMALGATGDPELAERVARATAVELRAVGVNVNYAPVCDLANNPANPALGIRSFGDDPAAVGRLAAATVRGLIGEGIAATVKHFPGAGSVTVDPHHELGVIPGDRAELGGRELVPFRAALEAGAQLVMAGHLAVPGLTGDRSLPASLAAAVLRDLLRDELGFTGLALSDALDMHALAQGAGQIVDAIAAVRAGEDVLLGTPGREQLTRLEEGLAQAELRGLIDAESGRATAKRLAALRRWVSGFDQPPLDVVGCAEHQALAAELARRSITLVRNDDGLLPLKIGQDKRVAVIQSQPANLTPADTSALVIPTLAAALRRRMPLTDEMILPVQPSPNDIAGARRRAESYDLVVVGTVAAQLQPAQAELARALLAAGRPTLTVALRTPWDLTAYPMSGSHVCSYGILPPTTEALAAALVGEVDFAGHLPVEIAGLYPRGHGLSAAGQVAGAPA
jgi:beta-N-acetylhexosaminidase